MDFTPIFLKFSNSDQFCSKFDPFCSGFDQFCSDFDKFCFEFDKFCSDFNHFPHVPITHCLSGDPASEAKNECGDLQYYYGLIINQSDWTAEHPDGHKIAQSDTKKIVRAFGAHYTAHFLVSFWPGMWPT